MMKYLCAALMVALNAGCGVNDRYEIEARNYRLEVVTDPYAYTVYDAEGSVVLGTLDRQSSEDNPTDGYAPFAIATGELEWSRGLITKGHYLFSANLDPWQESWSVDKAEQSDNELVLEFVPSSTDEITAQTPRIVVKHIVEDSSLRVELRAENTNPRAWAFAFDAPEDERYMGLGERFTRTEFRGTSIYSWSEEGGVGAGEGIAPDEHNPGPNGESMTYFPVPFFLSSEGYGFHYDTTWRNTFDFVSERDDAWRGWDIGQSTAYEVFLPDHSVQTPTWPMQAIDMFTEKVGRPYAPPVWGFGPRRRIGIHSMQNGVHEIQAMRDEDLAITSVDDAHHFLPNGSHIGNEQSRKQWVDYAHKLGYKVMAYYNSLFADLPDSPLREVIDEGIDQNYFMTNPDGSLSVVELISGELLPVLQVDFSYDPAVSWFQSTLDWALDIGYDGWMQDFGEYVQPESLAHNGMSGEEFHNLYPVLYDKAVFDKMQTTTKKDDWFAFARAGYSGSSQYVPAVWSGDPAASFESADGLPSMLRAAINIGIAGAPFWGGDIGGFHCNADGGSAADGELITRWIQQGALTPIMMDQDACIFNVDGVEKASI